MFLFLLQTSAVVLDLPALAQRLHQLPLHHMLNLEADLVQVRPFTCCLSFMDRKRSSVLQFEDFKLQHMGFLFQVSTPAELPAVGLTLKTNLCLPPPAALRGLPTNQKPSRAAAELPDSKPASVEDDCDEELDQLLHLQKAVSAAEEAPPEEGQRKCISCQNASVSVACWKLQLLNIFS